MSIPSSCSGSLSTRRRCRRVRARIARYRCGSGTFRMNVALSELPDFTCFPAGRAPHAARDRAVARLHGRGLSRRQAYRLIEAADGRDADSFDLDDELAPKGQHVASLFCQHFDPVFPMAATGTTRRRRPPTGHRRRQRLRAQLQARGPWPPVLSPLDLERKFGLDRRRHFPWPPALDQTFPLGRCRASPTTARRSTVSIVRSGTHPGGGVSGIPAQRGARILRDRGLLSAIGLALRGHRPGASR